MKTSVVSGKWKFDVEIEGNIKAQIDELRERHEEERFCNVYTDDTSTKEQVDSDCDNMIAIIVSLTEGGTKLQELVESHPKKANGTFAKGRVNVLYNAKSTSVLWEDSYCYVTYAIRAKSLSDTLLMVTLELEKNTW